MLKNVLSKGQTTSTTLKFSLSYYPGNKILEHSRVKILGETTAWVNTDTRSDMAVVASVSKGTVHPEKRA